MGTSIKLYLVRQGFYLPNEHYIPKELFVYHLVYVCRMGQSGIVYMELLELLHLSLTFEISLLLKSSTAVVASFVLNIPIPWRSQREDRTENGRGEVFFSPAC